MKTGDRVTLVTPDNPRLHGTPAVVLDLYPWGALVEAHAAATGRFRAGWGEMTPNATTNGKASRPRPAGMVPQHLGYEGDPCPTCGAMRLRRNGACLVCDACGSTTGCS